jgi:tetratricopeptide (TPR) repeat protein
MRSPLLLSLAMALAMGFSPKSAQAAISEAHQKVMAESFALFKKGAYAQAIEKAETISSSDKETSGTVSFFIASSHAKLQNFEKAAEYYRKTIAIGHSPAGIFYDYGQALFATQQLKEAEKAFRKSIIAKFKMGASAYYIAFIRQTLDDKPAARDFYDRIGKLSGDPDQVKQASLLQIAELALDDANQLKEQEKEKPALKAQRKRLLEGEVTNLYLRARDFSPETDTAKLAEKKLEDIEKELDAMVERMRNGNPMPRQAYTLSLSQDFTFDSNVITRADEALAQVSNKDAILWKTGLFARYQFNFMRALSVIPEFNSSITYHSRRTQGEVFQNDNIIIAPALRTKIEHWSGGKAATMSLDYEFNYMLRDWAKSHKFQYYTRSHNFVIGERVRWFDTGATTLKLNIKFVENYNPSKNNYTPGLSITQLFGLGSGLNLVTTASADYNHARDDINDEKNFKLRNSVTFANFWEKIDFTPALALTFKDTMKQKGGRGNEFTLNPSLGFTREILKRLDGALDFTYTKNYSKDKRNYQYTKYEAHFGATYRF